MVEPTRKILVLNGHPDPHSTGLCHALAEAYADGARGGGFAVRQLSVASVDFPLLRTQAEFEHGAPCPPIGAAQESVRWAQHLVVIFPLWFGDMPALLKGFFEQTLRPGFAFDYRPHGLPLMHFKGRTARIIVTMGMPSAVYRWYFRAHGVKNLARNILGFVGYGPVRDLLLGSVAQRKPHEIDRWLDGARELGRRGQ